MKVLERTIQLYRKVDNNEPMEEMHKRVMEGLSKIEAPLGLKDSEIPKTPDFGTELICFYDTKNIKTKGVKIKGSYDWRMINPLVWWDTLKYEFKITYKLIDYQKIIYKDLPKIITIYEPYIAYMYISPRYEIAYEEGRTPETITYYDSKNPNFLKLKETGVEIGILSDALFTLFPVMYFNEECYEKLIKVSKEELLKRLEGKAKKVLILEKGIYIIFNDKADISYEEFVEMNETFKPLLGLI
ncbi:helicase [Fusobacterium animalis]|uniref:helicase n=1 Tax=Fusobacterium animalis TaxID=76859 RepID=UPI001C6E349E|nr:helicase [Fusobacterium animalis]QYR65718.1 helicase [Fusobacterium animalis]